VKAGQRDSCLRVAQMATPSGSAPFVPVMQATNFGNRDNSSD